MFQHNIGINSRYNKSDGSVWNSSVDTQSAKLLDLSSFIKVSSIKEEGNIREIKEMVRQFNRTKVQIVARILEGREYIRKKERILEKLQERIEEKQKILEEKKKQKISEEEQRILEEEQRILEILKEKQKILEQRQKIFDERRRILEEEANLAELSSCAKESQIKLVGRLIDRLQTITTILLKLTQNLQLMKPQNLTAIPELILFSMTILERNSNECLGISKCALDINYDPPLTNYKLPPSGIFTVQTSINLLKELYIFYGKITLALKQHLEDIKKYKPNNHAKYVTVITSLIKCDQQELEPNFNQWLLKSVHAEKETGLLSSTKF